MAALCVTHSLRFMSDLSIRRLVPADWPLFRQLRLRALADSPDAFWATLEQEQAYDDAKWQEWMSPSKGLKAVAYLADAPAGMVGAHASPDIEGAAALYSMWVAPAARGTAVAALLVDEVMTWSEENGYPLVELCVTDGNDRAAAFYERLGFVYSGVTWPHNRDDALCYRQMTRKTG